MKRPIKFRALGISGMKDGFWCYGYYVKQENLHYGTIVEKEKGLECAVNENTLGQFTGLLDKNGKEIYEGDILSFQLVNYAYDEIDNPKAPKWLTKTDTVIFTKGCFQVSDTHFSSDHENLICYLTYGEVIGNIYEHKKLLTKK